MDLNAYQQHALRTATNPARRLDPQTDLIVRALGIAGEAGEVADLIKKWMEQGHELDVEKAKKELGDVLWYVAVVANCLGLTLDAVAEANVEKLRKRYPEGFSTERSLNRAGEG